MSYFKKRKETLILAAIIAAITLIPYILGYSIQGEQWRFTGFVIGIEDGNSYIAKMLTGSAGDWLFRSPFSSQTQQGVLAFLPYILLGKLTSGPGLHEQLISLYQFFRIIGIFLAVLATYDFISIFIQEKQLKFWTLLLVILGGGAGWILVFLQKKHFLGSVPLEFISPESFGFLGLLGFPHLAVARALLLWGLCCFLKRQQGYSAGLLWLIMGLFQPMVVVIAWAVIGTYNLVLVIDLLWSNDKTVRHKIPEILNIIKKPIQAILISSPIVIYTGIAFLSDSYLKGWAAQNQLPSPHFGHYLIAYGFMLPFVYGGIKQLLINNREQGLLIVGWLVLLPILIYAPISTQRRLVEGIWVAITISAMGIFLGKTVFTWKWKSYLMLAFPSSLILLAGTFLTVYDVSEPVYRPVDEINIFQYLGDLDLDRPVVLSSFETSNNLPAWIPASVVLGHGPESVGLEEIEIDLDRLFSKQSNENLRTEIWQYHNVDYLIWGPIENDQWNWSPDGAAELEQIYSVSDYAIYEVNAKK